LIVSFAFLFTGKREKKEGKEKDVRRWPACLRRGEKRGKKKKKKTKKKKQTGARKEEKRGRGGEKRGSSLPWHV